MALIFIAAEAREFRGLMRFLEDVRAVRARCSFLKIAQLKGRGICLAANGPGPALARGAIEEAMRIEETEVEALISIGFCGALSPALRIGEIFVATGVNGRPALQPRSSRPYASGPLLSIGRIAGSASQKAALAAGGAMAVEMEAAAVSEAAAEQRAPFYCVRAVSDSSNEDLPLDFNTCRGADGRLLRRKIAAAALRHPARIPALIQLGQSANRASEALGEFLANCEF